MKRNVMQNSVSVAEAPIANHEQKPKVGEIHIMHVSCMSASTNRERVVCGVSGLARKLVEEQHRSQGLCAVVGCQQASTLC